MPVVWQYACQARRIFSSFPVRLSMYFGENEICERQTGNIRRRSQSQSVCCDWWCGLTFFLVVVFAGLEILKTASYLVDKHWHSTLFYECFVVEPQPHSWRLNFTARCVQPIRDKNKEQKYPAAATHLSSQCQSLYSHLNVDAVVVVGILVFNFDECEC